MTKLKINYLYTELKGNGKISAEIDKEKFLKIVDNFIDNIHDIKSFILNLNVEEELIIEFDKKIYGMKLLNSPNLLINICLIFRFLLLNHSSWLKKKIKPDKWRENDDLISLWGKLTNNSALLSLKIDDDFSFCNNFIKKHLSEL